MPRFSAGIALTASLVIAAVANTAAPADAAKSKPVARDHRTTPAWDRKGKKTKPRAVIRDNRTTPTWKPKTTKSRWPHYPHKH